MGRTGTGSRVFSGSLLLAHCLIHDVLVMVTSYSIFFTVAEDTFVFVVCNSAQTVHPALHPTCCVKLAGVRPGAPASTRVQVPTPRPARPRARARVPPSHSLKQITLFAVSRLPDVGIWFLRMHDATSTLLHVFPLLHAPSRWNGSP